MSYEYKNYVIASIRNHVQYDGILPSLDGPDKMKVIKKIDEVYAKAKAFDEIEQVIYENTGLGEGDEDLVNYENLLDEIEIITNDVEREAE